MIVQFRTVLLFSPVLAAVLLSGCATVQRNTSCDSVPCDAMASSRLDVEHGAKIPVIDFAGAMIGVQDKIALLDFRANNHNISPATEREVTRYMRANRLTDTKLRVNQYDPIGELQRLVRNEQIAAPVRYTFGTYDWLRYTLLPGRLLGGDNYSPFTNSIHLYSDIPEIGLSQAAYAKDVKNRRFPSLYAASQQLPGPMGSISKIRASSEVLRYTGQTGGPAAVSNAKKILGPDLTGTLGAQALGFLPGGSAIGRTVGGLANHAFNGLRQLNASVLGN